MPTVTPEIPAANNLATPSASFETPNYLIGSGYFEIRMSDGTYHRFERSVGPDPLAPDYVKPRPIESHSDAKESHSKSYERWLILSQRVILYVDRHVVHSKPKPRLLEKTPEVEKTETVANGMEITVAGEKAFIVPKLPTAVKNPLPK